MSIHSLERNSLQRKINESMTKKDLEPITEDEFKSLGFIYKYKPDFNRIDSKEHSCNIWQCILLDFRSCNSSRDIDIKVTYLGDKHHPLRYRIEMYEKNHFEWFTIFEGKILDSEDLKVLLNRFKDDRQF